MITNGVHMSKQYKRISVDFPADEYMYLKIACARKGVSLKQFVTSAVIRDIEKYEDELDARSLDQITEEDMQKSVPWPQVKKELGWDKL